MGSIVVCGTLFCSDGSHIPLLVTTADNGTAAAVTTNTAFSVTASQAGTYAPGKTVVASSMFVSSNGTTYAYLLRAGEIMQVYPCGAGASASADGRIPCPKPVTLMAGDQVIVKPQAAGTRSVTFNCYTNAGNYHIFEGTNAGSTISLVSPVTGNGIGDTFQNQMVTQCFTSYAVAADALKMTTGNGVYVLDDKGVVIGAQQGINNLTQQPQWNTSRIPIGLNFAASVTTSA